MYKHVNWKTRIKSKRNDRYSVTKLIIIVLKFRLRVVLFDYVHQTHSKPISHLMELFPPEICLSQVFCTWKEIVSLQDAIKKRLTNLILLLGIKALLTS